MKFTKDCNYHLCSLCTCALSHTQSVTIVFNKKVITLYKWRITLLNNAHAKHIPTDDPEKMLLKYLGKGCKNERVLLTLCPFNKTHNQQTSSVFSSTQDIFSKLYCDHFDLGYVKIKHLKVCLWDFLLMFSVLHLRKGENYIPCLAVTRVVFAWNIKCIGELFQLICTTWHKHDLIIKIY